ncbi:MAG TPA: helicase-related protein, partial [Polyangiaceae bacterium]|nr:helicase-related protein [Polyangiaceae bacterium]
TAFAADAYAVGTDALIPVITAEVSRSEREEILAGFRDGRCRAIVSARVLNEGIDVPDASVAILVAGSLGVREHIQRIGRVLRPHRGKEALAYELVTMGTVDDRRSRARSKALATA